MKENFRARSRGNHSHNGDQIRWGGRIPVDPEGFYDDVIGGFHTNRKSVFTYKKSPHQYGFNGYKTEWFDRWLHKQVGRKWDDVWSEICAEFDARTHKGWYVREFMVRGYGDVDTKTFVDENGVVRTHSCYAGFRGNDWKGADFARAEGLYVHPVTGILCYQKPFGWNERWDIPQESKQPDKLAVNADGDLYVYSTYNYRYSIHSLKQPDEWYALEECGGPSPYDQKFYAWFHYSEKEVPYEYFCPLTDVEAQAKANFLRGRSVYYRDLTDEEILKSVGYEQKDSSGIPVWGKWHRGSNKTTTKRSCNKQQIARIKKFLNQ